MSWTFSINTFRSLPQTEVPKYVEPFLVSQRIQVQGDAERELRKILEEGDEVRIVYGLELFRILYPKKFPYVALKHLASNNSSVCSAAARLLETIAPHEVNHNFCDALLEIPIVTLKSWNPRTKHIVTLGSNQKFIVELVEHFRCSAK